MQGAGGALWDELRPLCDPRSYYKAAMVGILKDLGH